MVSIPRAGWLCALVALMSGIAWSLVVPPFQFADEPRHISYVQYLAETGRPPKGTTGLTGRSAQQRRVQHAMRYNQRRLETRALTAPADQRRIARALEAPASPLSQGGATSQTNNPPLYYALEALAYHASPSTNLLDRIQLMRLVSALLGALTVLLVFLFLRELLPATPWAWKLGALAVALQPLFNNESGVVNNDNLLYLAAAGLFLALAVSFRRGLTIWRGVAIGAAISVGLLAKLTMLGLIPGAALGLLLLVHRATPEQRRTTLRGAAAAVAVAALPVLAYMLVNSIVWDRGLLLSAGGGLPLPSDPTSSGSPITNAGSSHTIAGVLSYIWQFYLPRLPFMDPVNGFSYWPAGHIWFVGFVGRFGDLEYGLPGVADAIAAVVYCAIVGLAGRELFVRRLTLRARAAELATYVVIMLGLLAVIHIPGYNVRLRNEGGWEQARYLFPLLPLYAAIVAIAARGAGRRYGPAVAVLIVSFAIAHSLLALLVTLNRYYG
jgi:4-amino-4-deoxy-L-arabinose transferase-like glycosyltransferase